MAETAIYPERRLAPELDGSGATAVTVSLPAELLSYVDWRAASTATTRDGALAELLSEALRGERERLLVAGWLSYYGLDERPAEAGEISGWEESGAVLLERAVGAAVAAPGR